MRKLFFITLGLLLLTSAPAFAGKDDDIKVKHRLLRHDNGKVSYALSGWKGNSKIWEKNWDGLDQTELAIASPYGIQNGTLLVVVSTKLYSIDVATGNENFGRIGVGSCSHKPVVGKDGTIYCSGYYGPVITAVTPEGKVKWSYENEDMWWPEKIILKGNKILVFHAGASGDEKRVAVFNQSGRLLKNQLAQ